MRYTIPDYYHHFRCTADRCEDTCCAGWQIAIDGRSLRRYARIRGRMGRKLRKSIHWNRAVFRQKEGKRCAFLDEDNLCRMYAELGKSSLCRTCRLYPRHIEEFEGVREITLSLSCPAVAKILMNRREPVAYLSYEKEGEESYEDFDLLLYSVLADAREVVLDLLKNRALPVEQREEQMLSLADAVQKRYTDGMLFSCQELFCAYGNGEGTLAAAWEADGRRIRARLPFMVKLFSCLDTLELLREDWKNCLDETRAFLHMGTVDSYAGICLEFGTWLKERMPEWEIQAEQLLVYFIFTYFCGAAYDGRISAKAKLAAVSRMVIEEMLMARWMKNEKMLDSEDVIETVYRYSREIEHSDKNLKRMERIMEIVPANLTSSVSGFVPPYTV